MPFPALRRKPGLAGVVATSPAIRTATPPPGSQITLAKIMNRIRPEMQMANGLALDGLARDPEVIRAYTNDPLVHNKISVRLAPGMLQAGEWALAHAAEFPLRFVAGHGSADKLTSANATRNSPKGCQGRARSNCGKASTTKHTTNRKKLKCCPTWLIGCGDIRHNNTPQTIRLPRQAQNTRR